MKTWDDFTNFIVVDYEFRAGDGNPQIPICYVAKDLNTDTITKHWIQKDETKPVYPADKNTLLICYYASAEIGCHLSLNFQKPLYILDLFTEFRCLTNGQHLPCGNGLLGACAYYGIEDGDAAYKEETRNTILNHTIYTEEMKRNILKYCASDVDLTSLLFEKMKTDIDLPFALLRGRYMSAVASMEYYGIPIDSEKLDDLKLCWDVIKDELIWEVDQQYDIFEGTTFKIDKFKRYLEKNGIPWEFTETGIPKTGANYFKAQAKTHPELKPLQELRHSLSQLKLKNLQIGNDGRNRCLLSPFRSKTSRNYPSTSKFIFGPATWMRFLIKPEPGKALAYIDYEQQEIAIAAALSKDPNLIQDYNSGDPYLAFAKAAGAIPEDGTKETHPDIRAIYKRCMLALNYGMSVYSFARDVNISIPEAKFLIHRHKRRYKKYWEWNTNFIDIGLLSGLVKTRFNWYFQTLHAKYRTLMNWPMQSHGADILRLAISMCVDHDIRVIAPVHDAILIESTVENIDKDVKKAQHYMKRAAKYVIDFEIDTDVEIIRYPDRYTDKRGCVMWDAIWKIVDNIPQEQKYDLMRKQTQVELPSIESNVKTLLPKNIAKKRRGQLLMKPENMSEKSMAKRIREKSGFSHIEVMHLIRLARDSDFDLECEVDWNQDYDIAKKTILEALDPTMRSMKDLHAGDTF